MVLGWREGGEIHCGVGWGSWSWWWHLVVTLFEMPSMNGVPEVSWQAIAPILSLHHRCIRDSTAGNTFSPLCHGTTAHRRESQHRGSPGSRFTCLAGGGSSYKMLHSEPQSSHLENGSTDTTCDKIGEGLSARQIPWILRRNVSCHLVPCLEVVRDSQISPDRW